MSIALYRRYRPDTFTDLVGQDHVAQPLQAALRSGKVTHAYLFSGPRGCGKTTSARIMARCLNCAEGPTDTPCGKCPSCVGLATGGAGSLDVVEIDAASHNGVDDARELRERAAFAPARDRYKIFILDEAHMVTTQGFNALLKLVEEPPEHVKFIFATTEPEKVIGTIRSRTHHYPFRLVPPDILVNYLAKICQAEGISADEGVLRVVVRAGGGSVRDSLSVLDQLIAGTDSKELDYQKCVSLLGYTDAALLDDTVDALAGKDSAAVFKIIDRMVESGHDPRRFVEDLLERLRDLLIVAMAGNAAEHALHGIPTDQLERMHRQAQAWGAPALSFAADTTHDALNSMIGATSPRLQVELLAARLLVGAPGQGLSDQVAPTVGTAAPQVAVTREPAGVPTAAASINPDELSPGPGAEGFPDNPQEIREILRKKKQEAASSDSTPQPTEGVQSKPEQSVSTQAQPAPEAQSTYRQSASTQAPSTTGGAQPQSEQSADVLPTQPQPSSASSEPTADPEPTQPGDVAPSEVSSSVDSPERAVEETTPKDEPQTTLPVSQSTPVESVAQTSSPGDNVREEKPPIAADTTEAPSDAELIRRRWDDILSALERAGRSTWLRVKEAQVGPLLGNRLYVIHQSSNMIGLIHQGNHRQTIEQAIYDITGTKVILQAVTPDNVPSGGVLSQTGGQSPKDEPLATAAEPISQPGSADEAVPIEPEPDYDPNHIEPEYDPNQYVSDLDHDPNIAQPGPPLQPAENSDGHIIANNSTVHEASEPEENTPDTSRDFGEAAQSQHSAKDEEAAAFFQNFAAGRTQQSPGVTPMHATSEESNDSSESRIEHQAEDGLNNSQPIKTSKPDVTGKESQPPSDSADNDIEDDALLIDEPDIDNDEIVSSDDDHIISGTGVAHIEQILGGTIIEQTDLK